MLTKEQQIKFYKEELEELELEVKANFEVPAVSLFNLGKLYIAQYKGYDAKRGNLFFDIKNQEGYFTPRIDQLLNCFKLQNDKVLPRQWGSLSYRDLLKPLSLEHDMSEGKLVDYMSSEREGWIKMIISQVNIEFVEILKINDVLGFGPTIPPFDYLTNLLEFSENIGNEDTVSERILNFKYRYVAHRTPKLLLEDIDIASDIISKTDKSDIYVFEGPPGTGKTHQISDVISRLAKQNKSVLLTALTNKAAVEVCEKPFLNDLMKEGRIAKTNLQSKEANDFPHLMLAKEIYPVSGNIILSTYYQFSKVWKAFNHDFDYVIVEEASQAFLTTIAAAAKIGKKVIIVGDPYQILPIVKYKKYKNIAENIGLLVNGLQTICDFEEIPYYRKIETRRLTPRSTLYTNLFYQNTIVSKSLYTNLRLEKSKLDLLKEIIHDEGGPALLIFDKKGRKVIESFIPFLVTAINEISSKSNSSIAVLTPLVKKTLVDLQRNLKTRTKTKNYLVDSVDRVQGLDVDYCFYVITEDNYSFSYNLNRFNVATSRSKKATFILIEKDFHKRSLLRGTTGGYIKRLFAEFCFEVTPNGFIEAKSELLSEVKSNTGNIDAELYDKVFEILTNKGIISEDQFYNSLLDGKGNILAEAEFVFSYKDLKYAVAPFNASDIKTFTKNEYKIIELKDVIKMVNL